MTRAARRSAPAASGIRLFRELGAWQTIRCHLASADRVEFLARAAQQARHRGVWVLARALGDEILRALPGIDAAVLEGLKSANDRTGHPEIRRVQIASGGSSVLLNRVRVGSGPQARRLIEKAVLKNSNEMQFWSYVSENRLETAGDNYRLVRPLARFVQGPLGFLYYPFERRFAAGPAPMRGLESRRTFLRNLEGIVAGVAEFNMLTAGATGIEPQDLPAGYRRLPVLRRFVDLWRLHIADRKIFARSAMRYLEHYAAVRSCYRSLPSCYCHNDFGRWNFRVRKGMTYIIDFSATRVAPVGTDLYRVIADALGAARSPAIVDEVIGMYCGKIGRALPNVQHRQVEFAALLPFYFKYTDPANIIMRRSRSQTPRIAAGLLERIVDIARDARGCP
jgi:hypothetical protein